MTLSGDAAVRGHIGGFTQPHFVQRDANRLASSQHEPKDLRKTCATCYDAHVPESSIEILGHSVGGVTYRHYAHRDPLAFKAIMTCVRFDDTK